MPVLEADEGGGATKAGCRGRCVIMLAPFPPPYGGVSVHARRLSSQLQANGWAVQELAAGRRNPRPGDSRTPLLGNSIVKHVLAVVRSKAPILHMHDRLSVLTLFSCLAARIGGKRVVLTKHGIPRRLFSRTEGVDVFLRTSMRLADEVIAVSVQVEKVLRPFARKPIHVCPAYMPPTSEELDDMSPDIARWLKQSGEMPIITLLVTRLLPPGFKKQDVYGLGTARDVVLKLARAGLRFRFAVLLSSPPDGPEELRFWHNETGLLRSELGDRFGQFIGAYAPPLLGRTEVLLRPTLSDGDAVSIREALDLGCQVIASDVAPRPPGAITYVASDRARLFDEVAAALERATSRCRQRPAFPMTLEKHIELYESLILCGPLGGTRP